MLAYITERSGDFENSSMDKEGKVEEIITGDGPDVERKMLVLTADAVCEYCQVVSLLTRSLGGLNKVRNTLAI